MHEGPLQANSMNLRQPDELRYYTFASLEDAGVTHAVFTRRGGVSPEPWASLNVGGLVGDEKERIIENRRRSFQVLGKPPESIYDVWQVHGRDVVSAFSPRPLDFPHVKADAILTDTEGISLFMRFADCVPVLLFDPDRRVVGLAHAGWQGTVKRTVSATVDAMRDRYGVNPVNILAAIGPSIAAHHYEVGPEVIEQVESAFGMDAARLITTNGDSTHGQFDLWAANRLILEESGVKNIEITDFCTACRLEDWYSHRGEKGKTGRFGVLIALS